MKLSTPGLAPRFCSVESRLLLHVIQQPRPTLNSLPFAPPPRWATEVPKRLEKSFVDLQPERTILYLRALVHPSYASEKTKGGTMASLTCLGQAVLQHSTLAFLLNASPELSPAEAKRIQQTLTSQEVLSAVMKSQWCLEDMILTDAVIRDVDATKSNRGLLQSIQNRRTCVLPMVYHQQCVQAMVGAVYVDKGQSSAHQFVLNHVIPPALEFISL